VAPDVFSGTLQTDDLILLASDGLTGMLEDEQLVRILQSEGDPQAWVDRMIHEANRRGGLDNITAIIVRIEHADTPSGEYPVVPSNQDATV
jgi:protein phosphatase